MAVTIDPRPSYFGDRMIVTGTYGAGDAAIDLSSLLVSIDFAGVNPSGAHAFEQIGDTGGGSGGSQNVVFAPKARIDGTTIRIGSGVGDITDPDASDTALIAIGEAGTFFAIGRRS
mgnify:CR=1 FL=1|tara:strand:- start:1819 stop:2166 length:348 start_codon:yes stop_codon:yes gene_type:complete